jgi:sugar transferase (PEP-CTERM/EpsH1 system associated)
MEDILFLAHRLPYPPNKGDKVRSYHLLRHLARTHRVHLGTFVDDPDDARHVDALRGLCASVCALPLDPRWARLRGLAGLASGEPLTVPYYRDARLAAWVARTVRERSIGTAVVFSSAMAQYVTGLAGVRTLVDFVDVDSAKWSQYAGQRAWPLSWLYRREGDRLLAFERSTAAAAQRAFFVTDAEADLFRGLAPECARKTSVVSNGVDTDYYDPALPLATPFSADEEPVVFTGAMDYWPNVDAVTWFASEVLPALRTHRPRVRFYVVGMRPAPAVRALASPHVVVTGTVPDVRPFLAHARVVVAPLRIARGLQNKVLEAMAMGRPVVASQACAAPIAATPGVQIEWASDGAEFVERIAGLLGERERAKALGAAARALVLRDYGWDARLASVDRYLAAGDVLANAA